MANDYLKKIRAQYPQYNDIDDVTLAKKYREVHYADIDEDAFMDKIGLHQPTFTERAAPIVKSVLGTIIPDGEPIKSAAQRRRESMEPEAKSPERRIPNAFDGATVKDGMTVFDTLPGAGVQNDDVTATRSFRPAARSAVEEFNEAPVRMLSPAEQDAEVATQNAKTFSTQTELSDYGNSIMKGASNLYKGAGWAVQEIGEGTGVEGIKEYGQAMRDTGSDAAAYWEGGLSQAAKDARNVKFVARDENGDVSVADTLANIVNNPATVGLMGAESLPATGLGMGLGGIVTKGFTLIPQVGSKVASAFGYGIGEGAVAAASSGVGAEDQVLSMKHEQLMEHPEYRAVYLATNGDEDKARKIVADAAGDDAAALTFVTTTLLSSPFGYTMSHLFNPAGEAAEMLARKSVGAEAIKGGAGEMGQEVLQSGAEQVAQNYAINQHADTSVGLGDNVLESMVAGGVVGFGMGATMGAGQTAMNNRKVTQYENALEDQRDALIQDAYNKSMMSGGMEMQLSDDPLESFAADVDSRIGAIRSSLTNLSINHPEFTIPEEAKTDPVVAEAVIAEAQAQGLNATDNNGLNQIDVSYQQLADEIGIDLTPVANTIQEPIETAQPIIEKPIIGQPEPEAVVQNGLTTDVGDMNVVETENIKRIQELEAIPDDELTVEQQWELEDLRKGAGENFPGENTESDTTSNGVKTQIRKDDRLEELNSQELQSLYENIKPSSRKGFDDVVNMYQDELAHNPNDEQAKEQLAWYTSDEFKKQAIRVDNAMNELFKKKDANVGTDTNSNIANATTPDSAADTGGDAGQGAGAMQEAGVGGEELNPINTDIEKEYDELLTQVFSGTNDEKVLQRIEELDANFISILGESDATEATTAQNEEQGVQPVQEVSGAGEQPRGGGTVDSKQVPADGAKPVKIVFDVNKVYSTVGINHEYPNRTVSKRIQKDVAKYAQQLAKALGGWGVETDKKGKPLPFMGVSDNVAPAGGDVSFKLFMPNTNIGIYINIDVSLGENDDGEDTYVYADPFGHSDVLYRITYKDKRNDGGNNFIQKEDLTSEKFVRDIMSMVEREAAKLQQKENEGVQNNDSRTAGTLREGILPDGQDAAGRDGQEGIRPPVQSEGAGKLSQDQNQGDAGRASDADGAGNGSADGERDRGEPSYREPVAESNFVLKDDDPIIKGKVTRYSANIRAIKLLKQNKKFYTADEKKALSQFTGWGGLQEAFYRDGVAAKGWEDRARELKEAMSREEYDAAERSVLDAFYTPADIIAKMWGISERLGFRGGRVLEPSAGVGRFIGLTPSVQTKEDNATDHYARANGYDEPGINYVPSYKVSGRPERPADGYITLGSDVVELPAKESPINAESIRVYLADVIGPRLYEAKIHGNKNLGIYRERDSSIRLQSFSDIEVMAHEMAHWLDYFYKNPQKKGTTSFFRKEILKNKEELKAISYTTDPKESINEGFAEFIRLYLTNYNAAAQYAPGMLADFETKLAEDKELGAKMKRLRDGMHQYYYQGRGTRKYQGGELNDTAAKLKRSQRQIAAEARQKIIDKIHSIKRIEADVRGDVATDAMNSPYKALQLVNGYSSVVYAAMNIGVPTIAENGDITYSGKSLNAIFEPATKHGEERVRLLSDYLVAKRADELMAQGRENLISREDIAADLKLAEEHPEFETIFSEYQEFNTAMLDFYVAMDHITAAQRENFLENNQNYVPFHRVIESVQFGKTVQMSNISKRLTGGTHSLGNIMENIISGLESNIKEAMISHGKSMFYRMLEESGMGGVYATRVPLESEYFKADMNQQISNVARIMQQLGLTVSKDGMIYPGEMNNDPVDVDEIAEALMARPELMEYFSHGHPPQAGTDSYIDSAIIGGTRVYFETKDAALVEAMTSFSATHNNLAMQWLMSVKNIMTWNITNNPLFYLPNFARDTISASVLSKNGFVPVLSSIRGMYHFVTQSKVYKDFMASGAGYGTLRATSGNEANAMRMLNVNRGLDLFNKIISAASYGADMFEYGTRIGEFELAQKAGKTNWQAAFEGREISTDFAIKGANRDLTSFMATVPFMKAAINGIDKTARRVFSINGEMKLTNMTKFRNAQGELQQQKVKIYAAGSMIALASLALFFANKDDERYKRLTRDQKLMYWHVFVGDRHIKIPKPYDIGFVFASLPEIIANGIYTKHGEDALKEFMFGIKTMFSIGDVSGMFQPILDHMTNTNWMGSPIVPGSVQNVEDKSDQYTDGTALMYRRFGEITGASPIITQHYVDGYLGLTARMIEETTENILWDKKSWGERPFARNPVELMTYRFTGKKEESRTYWSEKYYEISRRAEAVKNSYKLKEDKAYRDGGDALRSYANDDERQALIGISSMTGRMDRALGQLKTELEAVTYDKRLSAAQKEKIINDAYKAKRETLQTIVEALDAELKKVEK